MSVGRELIGTNLTNQQQTYDPMKTTEYHPRLLNPESIPSATGQIPVLRHGASAILAVLVFFAVGQFSAHAQNRQVRSQPARITVQSGVSGVVTNTIYVVTTNTSTPINLSVGPLPTGVTSATLDMASFTDPGGYALLTVHYDGTVPQTGTNEIAINASGDYTYRLPVPIHSAILWAGDTTNNLWADSANWGGGVLPTAGDVVVFPSAGANDHGTNSYTNVLLSTSREVSGLRFSHGDKANDQTYGFEIKPDAALSVTGPSGFSFLQDTIDTPGTMEVDFFGGGNLLVSNAEANVALLKDFQQNSILDMSGLDTFKADVDRIGLGDYTLYPYYENNGYSVQGGSGTNSRPSRFVPQVTLAKTNFLRATHVDPNNYTNSENRDYALTISKTASQATGSGTQFSFILGRSNVFFMDSIVFGASGAKAENDNRIIFNTDTNFIPTNVMPVAYFRGADGVSRMSVFTVADATGPGGSGSGTKATVNLNGGYVDALIDRLYIGRDRQESQDNDTAQGVLSIAHGIFDVNTAVISSQELGNNTIPTDEQGSDPSGEVYGTLNVSTNAVFKVNGTLHLGYTTADPGDKRVAEDGNGQLNISSGGLVMASNIFVGGVTKVSVNNRISITAGGQLIVTNEIGESDKSLNSLTMNDSTLTLHVDGSKSTPYVYVNSLVTGGSGNTIKLASVVNVTTFPVQLPLIAYQTASPNFGVDLPSGFYGYIVNNTANQTIDVVILNSAPNERVWNGSPGTIWNTSSANWKGGETFVNGDTARFDDTAASPSVNLSDVVFVGGSGVLVTNNMLAYSFGGSGEIGGTSPLNKWGSAGMTMNAMCDLPVNIHEGSVDGYGALGATTVSSNASLTFSGAINRLVSSGTSVLSAGGTIANTATVQAGSLTDSGTITNTILVRSNATMTVTTGGKVVVNALSNSQIDQGGNLVLNGIWQNGSSSGPAGTYRLDIFGKLTGTGAILGARDLTAAEPNQRSRLNIGSGGVLSPGSAPGDIVTFTNQGRFDFVQGSRIIMDVDMDSADGSNPFGSVPNGSANAKRSDVLYLDRWSTVQGTLQITNIGTQPFAVGTVLKLFKRDFDQFGPTFGNVPLNDGQLPVMDPESPGLGMIWDLSKFRTNGVISILGTATNPPTLDAFYFQRTNVTFSWPTNHIGWELLTQTRPLTNGLSLARSNWTVVAGSTATNLITITNWIGKDPGAVFYRLGHPQYQ